MWLFVFMLFSLARVVFQSQVLEKAENDYADANPEEMEEEDEEENEGEVRWLIIIWGAHFVFTVIATFSPPVCKMSKAAHEITARCDVHQARSPISLL